MLLSLVKLTSKKRKRLLQFLQNRNLPSAPAQKVPKGQTILIYEALIYLIQYGPAFQWDRSDRIVRSFASPAPPLLCRRRCHKNRSIGELDTLSLPLSHLHALTHTHSLSATRTLSLSLCNTHMHSPIMRFSLEYQSGHMRKINIRFNEPSLSFLPS